MERMLSLEKKTYPNGDDYIQVKVGNDILGCLDIASNGEFIPSFCKKSRSKRDAVMFMIERKRKQLNDKLRLLAVAEIEVRSIVKRQKDETHEEYRKRRKLEQDLTKLRLRGRMLRNAPKRGQARHGNSKP